jgi:hypothetical protein
VVAHELPRVLLEPSLEVDVRLLVEARNLVHKLERWWFENYHAEIDPEALSGRSIEETEYGSGRMIYIDHVIASVGESLSEPARSRPLEVDERGRGRATVRRASGDRRPLAAARHRAAIRAARPTSGL